MPKFRVRCDNPKTDFESASLHTARAAAKDVSLRAHEPVQVIEVTDDGAEKLVHTDPPRTSGSAPIELGTDGATMTALRCRSRSRTLRADDALSLLDRPTNVPE